MGSFAWRNLLTRPLRTILALIGLSIPILGVMGLFSVSQGVRDMVGDTLNQVEGVMVLRENSPSPVFSDLESSVGDKLRSIKGVRVVAPELWRIAPSVEGMSIISKLKTGGGPGNLFDQPVIQGQDILAHQSLKSAVYPRAMKNRKGEGRFLLPSDVNKPHIVISRKLSRDFLKADGKPRGVGDSLDIGGKPFQIIGIYDTGSMLLDGVIIMDIDSARQLMGVSKDMVSSFYVEARDPGDNDRISEAIESSMPRVDARSMTEFMATFESIMGQLDKFLMMTISLALVVGVVGIINTMLMSTTERFVEFGVLRTNGWSQGHILKLVTLESAYLGLLSGVVGCLLAWLGTLAANQFLTEGVRLSIPPWLYLLGISLSVVTGTLGGLYPAWRAARLVPMDAIRVGSH